MTPDVAGQLGVDRNTRGAVITRVAPDSVAARAGLHAGDLIVAIDQAAVTNAEDAASRLRQSRPEGHIIRVLRDGRALFVVTPSAK